MANSRVDSIKNFIHYDLWRLNVRKLPRVTKFFVRQLRVIVLAIKGFNNDKGALHASALTFYSTLSIVPGFAIAFGIAQVFGFQKTLEKELARSFQGQEEVMDYLFQFSRSLLENTKGGFLAGVGFVFILYTTMRLLDNIETSFNSIWGIKKHRPIMRKLTDYLAILIIGPVLIVLSSSSTVFIQTQIVKVIQDVELLGYFSSFILYLLTFSPYVIIWLLLTLLYMIMPNTKVNLSSALIAGIIAGTIFQLVQIVYINFQIGVSRSNAIYGSFAALPLFLIWMQLSWIIIMVGAEISFAIQNVEKFDFLNESTNLSPSFKKKLCVFIVYAIVRDFSRNTPPITSSQISKKLELPGNMVVKLLNELIEADLIKQTEINTEGDVGYVPAVDTDLLTIKFVMDKLENKGIGEFEVVQSDELQKLEEAFDKLNKQQSKSTHNLKLKNVKLDKDF